MVKVKILTFNISKTHFTYFNTLFHNLLCINSLIFFTSKPNIVQFFTNFFLTSSLPQKPTNPPIQSATKTQHHQPPPPLPLGTKRH